MLLTAQVVRGSVGSLNVMVGDRLELDACDLELVCTLYLVPSTFEVSAWPGVFIARRAPFEKENFPSNGNSDSQELDTVERSLQPVHEPLEFWPPPNRHNQTDVKAEFSECAS